MSAWRLICDVGGSNARFAASTAPGQIDGLHVVPSSAMTDFTASLLADIARRPHPDALTSVAIAAAGPIDDQRVALTNVEGCVIDAAAISAAIAGKPVSLLNDLEAAAWCLPIVGEDQRMTILDPASPLHGPRLIVNVGTGFGAAVLLSVTEGWHAIACEPGHMKFAGATTPAAGILSVEDVLSGRALAAAGLHLDATTAPSEDDAAKIDELGARLGQICGDLVLACGAWGGVSLCGSVARTWSHLRRFDTFATAFVDKGPMRPRMLRVGVDCLTAPEPPLLGLSALKI